MNTNHYNEAVLKKLDIYFFFYLSGAEAQWVLASTFELPTLDREHARSTNKFSDKFTRNILHKNPP